MKTIFTLPVVLFILILLSGLLSSFALVPAPSTLSSTLPIKAPRAQQQQQRLLRLEKRLSRAQRPKQRLRLQKRIQQMRDGERKNWVWAITGFSISTLGFLLFIVLLAGGINSLGGAIIGILILIILSILGLIFSIIGVIVPSNDEKFGGRGLAIADIAITSTFLLLFLMVALFGTP